MATVPDSPVARAIQALRDAEVTLRTMSSATQNVTNGVDAAVGSLDAAVDRLEAASDGLKTVSASNAVIVASIDAAANASVRAAAALEDGGETR